MKILLLHSLVTHRLCAKVKRYYHADNRHHIVRRDNLFDSEIRKHEDANKGYNGLYLEKGCDVVNKFSHCFCPPLSAVEQFVPSLYADYAVNVVKMFLLIALDRRLGVAAKRSVNDDECLAVKVDILKLPE